MSLGRRVLAFDVGIRSLAYCLVALDDEDRDAAAARCPGEHPAWAGFRLVAWDECDVTRYGTRDGEPAKDVRRLPVDRVIPAMIEALAERDPLLLGDDDGRALPEAIVVERQPRMNPKMQMVSSALLAYYGVRLRGRTSESSGKPVAVTLCSAARKTAILASRAPAADDESADDDEQGAAAPKGAPKRGVKRGSRGVKYRNRKREAAERCKALFEARSDGTLAAFAERLRPLSKLHNLADALWYALAHLERSRPGTTPKRRKSVE